MAAMDTVWTLSRCQPLWLIMAGSVLALPAQPGFAASRSVYAVDLEDGAGVPGSIIRLSPPGDFFQPMVNRDGSSVVFWGKHKNEAGFNIWRTDLDTKVPVNLTRTNAVSGHPFWSADGETIVFFSTRGLSSETGWSMKTHFDTNRSPRNIWAMQRDGSRLRQLTRGDFADDRPCISPDGKHVVFVSNRGGGPFLSLWSVAMDTLELRRVTDGSQLAYRPIFSPSGDRLAFFTGTKRLNSHRLAFMNWEDREISHPLPADAFKWVHGPFWLGDGRSILLHGIGKAERKAALWRVDLQSHRITKVTVPGFKVYAHGTVDTARSLLVFDSRDPWRSRR